MRATTRRSVGIARAALVLLVGLVAGSGCSGKKDASEPTGPAATATQPGAETVAPVAAVDEPLPPLPYESALGEDIRARIDEPFTGDLDEMVERRIVRVGVAYNRTLYFVDQGMQRGAAFEYGKLMEDELNKRRKTGNLKVVFWYVPLPRDRLLPALVDGKVDMVIAQLTVTPERQQLVDFTNPTRSNVNEIVVTGPGAPTIASIDDLAGQEVFVRKSSSYYQSLLALNERLKAAGKPPVSVRPAPENLEDDDLLEMVNAGLIKIIVVDDFLAEFWKQVLTDLTLHETVALRSGGTLAVAIRKGSPQLAAGLNAIIAEHGLGSAFGNTMEKRYLQSTKFVRDATAEAERQKFVALVELFRRYSDQYDVDYLLMAAQGFQESGLDHSVRSPVGAIGVMQVMPATGKDLAVGDISKLEPNIHAGVKYMRWVMEEYYKDEPMDRLNKGLFAFASYNAGPGRIR
jgi:membrane-bound lytic murein transglycosylase MltF